MSAVTEAVAYLNESAEGTDAPFTFTGDEATNVVTFHVTRPSTGESVEWGTVQLPSEPGGVYGANIVGGDETTVIETESLGEAAGLLALALLLAIV